MIENLGSLLMQRIEIQRQLGNRIVTREDGRRLRDLIEQRLNDPPVVVDFEGLQVTSVSFFDEAFGALVLRMGDNQLLHDVRFERIDKFDLALVKDIISSRAREASVVSRKNL